jgi:ParB-like chromosome segregation protein Spo0J
MDHVSKIKQVKTESLKPNPKNPRVHPQGQVDKIAKSIEAFGFNNPILTHAGVVVAGHGRKTAERVCHGGDKE